VWEAATAVEALDAFVAVNADVLPNMVVIATTLEDASRVDPDAATTRQAPVEGRVADCLRLAKWLQRDGVLAPGVTVNEARDVIFTLCDYRTYEALVSYRGWPAARYVRWLRRALRLVLLVPSLDH
jgi:hypothetical protein